MATGTFMPGGFRTNVQKLSKGYWPWTEGIRSRLPMHYKKRFALKYMTEPAPVHYRPDPRKYTIDEYGIRRPVQNVPIPVYYPPEAEEGLWGGVGIIKGFTKRKNWFIKPRAPKIWMPRIIKRVFYSEILDRWMSINCTQTTLSLIDDAFGFDNYILKTSEADLKSNLGMRLKREMLLTLVRRSMYPNNPEKAAEIAEKYQQFVIP
ncbi:hypothetical protein NP493_141g03016 [Ridgeia piscesae]|uniref:Large ribosomal subunit protein bL28m n=1 Tax=Ridgeia piscesae TaxID=27915 RepID=A0AAD9P525_RIDPI|nr:hypothetical protein NP493_141g03016 [Ridgeia piscesae]